MTSEVYCSRRPNALSRTPKNNIWFIYNLDAANLLLSTEVVTPMFLKSNMTKRSDIDCFTPGLLHKAEDCVINKIVIVLPENIVLTPSFVGDQVSLMWSCAEYPKYGEALAYFFSFFEKEFRSKYSDIIGICNDVFPRMPGSEDRPYFFKLFSKGKTQKIVKKRRYTPTEDGKDLEYVEDDDDDDDESNSRGDETIQDKLTREVLEPYLAKLREHETRLATVQGISPETRQYLCTRQAFDLNNFYFKFEDGSKNNVGKKSITFGLTLQMYEQLQSSVPFTARKTRVKPVEKPVEEADVPTDIDA